MANERPAQSNNAKILYCAALYVICVCIRFIIRLLDSTNIHLNWIAVMNGWLPPDVYKQQLKTIRKMYAAKLNCCSRSRKKKSSKCRQFCRFYCKEWTNIQINDLMWPQRNLAQPHTTKQISRRIKQQQNITNLQLVQQIRWNGLKSAPVSMHRFSWRINFVYLSIIGYRLRWGLWIVSPLLVKLRLCSCGQCLWNRCGCLVLCVALCILQI